jgi:hypothetical protein
LGDWVAAGSGGGGWLVEAALLVFITMLIFLNADFVAPQKYFFPHPKKCYFTMCPFFWCIIFRRLYGEILRRAIFWFFNFEYPTEKPRGEGAIVFSLGQTKLN